MNEDNEKLKSELVSWIKESVKSEHFQTCDVTIANNSELTGGYTGNIVYVTVIGTTEQDVKKEIDLVVKYGKENEELRKSFHTRLIFEKEIYFYEQIVPIYTQFQLENNVKNVFDSVPRCWKSFIFDNTEAIILDNLKKQGFEMYDRKKPLNLSHIKLILKEYAKFHAISFAFRDQRNEEFKKLMENYNDLMKLFFSDEGFTERMRSAVDEACAILEEMGEHALLEKYKKIQEKSGDVAMMDILNAIEPQSAVTHGDCWNNNFIFKYQAEDRSSPIKVAILDWQVYKLHSPVLDLSNFLYIVSSGNELEHFAELLDIYYDSFSSFLSQLGSDPERLFPFSALKRHWEKYSLYGVLIATLFLQLTVCDQTEVPELNDLKEGGSFGDLFNVHNKDQTLFKERLVAIIRHYYTFKFN